jgi:predicted NUDIX family NTP pyrophosphohydrolase
MAARRSAGIVLVRQSGEGAGPVEILLVHPGGPFWAKKDAGAWSIPKGEYELGEDPRLVAEREFLEELGVACPDGDLIDVGAITQSGGKEVTAWCGVGTIDTSTIVSNTFEMVWPPKSGNVQRFPEVDRAGFFGLEVALQKVLASQRPLLERAVRALADAGRISRPAAG